MWAKSQHSVHKPQFLKRKESRSGSNQSPSAYQPCALPLGHTSSHDRDNGDSHKNTQSATQTRLADRNAKPAPCVGIRLANLKHIVHHSDSAYVWQPTTLFWFQIRFSIKLPFQVLCVVFAVTQRLVNVYSLRKFEYLYKRNNYMLHFSCSFDLYMPRNLYHLAL